MTARALRADLNYQGQVYRCRLIATMVVDGGPDHFIWHHDADGVDFFFTAPVTGPGSDKPQFHTTIRKAFSWVCKQEGWG